MWKLFEFLCHGPYMRIIPPAHERVPAHVRDTCMKFWEIHKCKVYMLVTCRKCIRINNVSFSSAMVLDCTFIEEVPLSFAPHCVRPTEET